MKVPASVPKSRDRSSTPATALTDACGLPTSECHAMPIGAFLQHIRAALPPESVQDEPPSMLHAMHDFVGDVLLRAPCLKSAASSSPSAPQSVAFLAASTASVPPTWDTGPDAGGTAFASRADVAPALPHQSATAVLQASQLMAAAFHKLSCLHSCDVPSDDAMADAAEASIALGSSDRWASDLALVRSMLVQAPMDAIEAQSRGASAGFVDALAFPDAPDIVPTMCPFSSSPTGEVFPGGCLQSSPGDNAPYGNGGPARTHQPASGTALGGVVCSPVAASVSTSSACGLPARPGDRMLPFLQKPYSVLHQLQTRPEHEGQPQGRSAFSSESACSTAGDSNLSHCGAGVPVQGLGPASPPMAAPCLQPPTTEAGNGQGARPLARPLQGDGVCEPLQGTALSPPWRSVLGVLVNAGPHVLAPGSPFLQSGSAWGSAPSSHEQDAVSFRSDEALPVDVVTATTATPAAGKKVKRKRNKRAKGAAR